MALLIALEEYRARKALQEHAEPTPLLRPKILDAEVWSKDYSRFEHAIFAIVKIREILDYHLHYSEEWKFYLLKLLEGIYRLHEEQISGRLGEDIALLKTYIAGESNVINRRELSVALVILDLLDKGARMQSEGATH